jgi:hypothetical protein
MAELRRLLALASLRPLQALFVFPNRAQIGINHDLRRIVDLGQWLSWNTTQALLHQRIESVFGATNPSFDDNPVC